MVHRKSRIFQECKLRNVSMKKRSIKATARRVSLKIKKDGFAYDPNRTTKTHRNFDTPIVLIKKTGIVQERKTKKTRSGTCAACASGEGATLPGQSGSLEVIPHPPPWAESTISTQRESAMWHPPKANLSQLEANLSQLELNLNQLEASVMPLKTARRQFENA